MFYHNIVKNDMLNGDGLRVTLFVSGCSHNCPNCQNPQTHSPTSGIEFDVSALSEIFEQLDQNYISGLTLSGGDPLYCDNRAKIYYICNKVKQLYSNKTIWLYTGFRWEEIKDLLLLKYVDVLVDGRFIEALKDNTENCKWRGSSNQKIIDVQKSLKEKEVILYE